MSTYSQNIEIPKTIREFLVSNLKNIEKPTAVEATINGGFVAIYDVDVIWDGNNYYLAYTLAEDSNTIIINDLDTLLPLKIVPIATI